MFLACSGILRVALGADVSALVTCRGLLAIMLGLPLARLETR